MPIYEFSCHGCRRRVEIFRRSLTSSAPFRCPHCGSEELSRLVSRFAVHRSAGEFGSADEEQYIAGLEDGDPRAMASWARRMGEESGEGTDPEFQQVLAQMEAGEMPQGFDDDGGLDDDGDDLGF